MSKQTYKNLVSSEMSISQNADNYVNWSVNETVKLTCCEPKKGTNTSSLSTLGKSCCISVWQNLLPHVDILYVVLQLLRSWFY